MLHFAHATPTDIAALSDLLTVLFTQEAEFRPDAQAQCRGLAEIIANPALGAILLARDGTEIVAMVNLLFTVSTALGGRVALLEDMVVAPVARGKGVGSALLEHALDYARRSGLMRITLLTDHDNHFARRFYARHGFTESTMLALRHTMP